MKSARKYISKYPIECGVIVVLFGFALFTIGSQFRLLNHVVFSLVIVLTLLQTFRSLAENDRDSRIYYFTMFVLLASPISIYAITLVISYYKSDLIQVSNASGWIGFAGSIIGGTMTMFALIFTIQSEERKRNEDKVQIRIEKRENQADSLLPVVFTTLECTDEELKIIKVTESTDTFDTIEFSAKCLNKNIAKDYSLISIKHAKVVNDVIKLDEWEENSGDLEIAKMTVKKELVQENIPISFSLCIDRNKIGRTIIYRITSRYSDILDLREYTHVLDVWIKQIFEGIQYTYQIEYMNNSINKEDINFEK